MDLAGVNEMTFEQSRHVDDLRSMWRELLPLYRDDADEPGGYQWKTVNGAEYLTRFHTDLRTMRKVARSEGRRSPRTEARYRDFYKRRQRRKDELDAREPRLSTLRRVSKALRLGSMPTEYGSLCRQFDVIRFWEYGAVLGEAAVHAYAAASRTPLPAGVAKGGRDLELLVPNFAARAVPFLVRLGLHRTDRKAKWSVEGGVISDGRGLRVHVHTAASLTEAGAFASGMTDAQEHAVAYALQAPFVHGFAVAADGEPVPLTVLDPRAWCILHSARAVYGPSRSEEDKARDLVQARFVADIAREKLGLTLCPYHCEAFPDLGFRTEDWTGDDGRDASALMPHVKICETAPEP